MDTLSSLMEVKLDIREKRTEWLPLRSWTRCYIKIEAIKCFPCYMKFSFHKTVNENDNGLVLRVNIPGLDIYPVKSRTKEFAYGLFWKQNRKNCMAFLSLDSKLSMDAHMQWVYCQIQSLEAFRKDVLQSSRCSRIEQSLIDAEDSGIYQNMNDTCQVRDVRDILGPLPAVPNGCAANDKNWSRRVSALSGIYEEITDPTTRSKIGRESAIYEEMKINRVEPTSLPPPPLPPRVRKNTDCSSLQRSYTTPESEMVKKKWTLFENVFGKSKRSELKRRERPVQKVQPRELQLLKAKRNSFSSPDLSHLDVSYDNSGCENCSFDQENPSNISASNSYELENLCEEEVEHEIMTDSNISRNIKPNFKLPLDRNLSSVNLVGSSYNLGIIDDSSPQTQPSTSPPGYLEMRPGRGFDMKKVEELDAQIKNDVLYRLKYSFDSPITYKREFDYDAVPPAKSILFDNESKVEPHYVCMTKGMKVSPQPPPRTPKNDESTYMPMNRLPNVNVETHQNIQNSQIESTKTSCARTKRHSVDEKIASYYPNYDVPVKCNGSPSIKISTAESIVIKKSPPKIITTEPCEQQRNGDLQKGDLSPRKGKRLGSFSMTSRSQYENGKSLSQEISKKYATISRVTVKSNMDEHHHNHHLSPTTIKKSGSISPTSIKRFTSLPRFKKLDFSPLRLKISSVLQRNNAGGC